MYYTFRQFYPHGIEGEEMQVTVKEHNSFDKAFDYCSRYNKGVKFAGVIITNEKFDTLYEITSDQEHYDYREGAKQ